MKKLKFVTMACCVAAMGLTSCLNDSDDNVHFQNSAEMVEKLENAGKQFEFRIYPNKNHSIYDATGNTRLNLYQLMTDFILRKL